MVRRAVLLKVTDTKEMTMFDGLAKFGAVGRRLAEAGKQARGEAMSVAGSAGGQVVEAAALAAGEVVRCAVAGAITAMVRGSRVRVRTPVIGSDGEDGNEFGASDPIIPLDMPVAENQADGTAPDTTANPKSPRWMAATRTIGSALTVAAGAAAAVPGGRLVAAGLGAVAAVAALAAKAGNETIG